MIQRHFTSHNEIYIISVEITSVKLFILRLWWGIYLVDRLVVVFLLGLAVSEHIGHSFHLPPVRHVFKVLKVLLKVLNVLPNDLKVLLKVLKVLIQICMLSSTHHTQKIT